MFKALAPNMEGEYVFISRFLHPHGQKPPPKHFLNSAAPRDDSVNADVSECLRFVSLIPFLSDFTVFRDLDMWCTSAQFLEILAGDDEEHAILLWNFFQYLAQHREFRIMESEKEADRDGEDTRRDSRFRSSRVSVHESTCDPSLDPMVWCVAGEETPLKA